MKGNVVFSITKASEGLEALVEELFEKAVDPPVFYSKGMLQVWREISHVNYHLATLEVEGHLCFALPIIKDKCWKNVSFDGWDNLDVLRSSKASADHERKFWLMLVEKVGFVKLTEFSQNSTAFKDVSKIKSALVDRRKCPFIRLEFNWQSLNKSLSKKLTRNLRQYGNKALAAGITFSVKNAGKLTPEEQHKKLKKAFSFHEVRMEELNQKSKFSAQQREEYHQTVLQQAENTFVIEAKNENQETIAFYYGLFNKSRLAWFNGGYSADYHNYSIGTLLVAELISYAMKNGMYVFDFLRGNEEYKQKWTSDFDLNKDIYLVSRNLKHRLIWYRTLFYDTRKRVGSKNAFIKIISLK